MHFTIKIFSRLRRGDFRYTKIFFLTFSYVFFFRASGEAILGTQRYLDDATRRDNIRDNIRDYPSTLSKHFTQALYQSTLSKHFIKVFLKHFRNTRQGITKVLRQGITTRYYKGITTRYYKGIKTRY